MSRTLNACERHYPAIDMGALTNNNTLHETNEMEATVIIYSVQKWVHFFKPEPFHWS